MNITKLDPQDFEIVSGNHKTLQFTTLTESDEIVDLTGASIIWAMSNSAKAKSTLIEYTSANFITIVDAPAGRFDVLIQDVDTEGLKGGDYYHEARVTSAGGKKTTVAIGTVRLLNNIIDT